MKNVNLWLSLTKEVIKTRSNHTILLDDSDKNMSITILDQSGNTIFLDTVGKNITIEAPETINIKCKNLNVEVSENAKTNIGKNQETHIGENAKTIVGKENSLDSGGKMILSSGKTLEISAKQDLDLYGKQKLISYTDGKAEIGAKERMHLFGTNSLITAKDKIEYKAPKMNKLPQKGEFKYDKEKQILSVKWMNAQMDTRIKNTAFDEKLSLLVQTRNYEEGETISLVIDEQEGQDINEQGKEITLTGKVDKNGFALLKEEVEVLQETKAEKKEAEQKQQAEKAKQETEIYKTYEGKNYTYNEWKIKEQELWEAYQQTKKKKK